MDREQFNFCNKLYNELLNRKRINPDKYEREDAFMGAIMDIENGKDMKDAFIDSFKSVHNIEITDEIYQSCFHLVKGFSK